MNEDMVLYGVAIGFLSAAERLRLYEDRAAILNEWVAAGYGDPQLIQWAQKMTDMRLKRIRVLVLKGGK